MSERPALLCFSHLRWDHVFQRPNHLMVRAGKSFEVFFVEEPVMGADSGVRVDGVAPGVQRVVPTLPAALAPDTGAPILRALLDDLIRKHRMGAPALWYYNPLALRYTRHLDASVVVYDCMDELGGFKGAAGQLSKLEAELFERADVVFTGGQSLFEAKRTRHANIHAFPSSVDVGHFRQARDALREPADQRGIRRPRLGFLGVIDERIDLELLDSLAAARPGWQFVLVGPVMKVEAEHLPRRDNVHFLGKKDYRVLPAYLGGWDVALMPFAHNAATRYISPTKTPEYLAAGLPVVSTSIVDVVQPYGERKLVRIADDWAGFVTAIEAALGEPRGEHLARADSFLAGVSWDRTWERMALLVDEARGDRLRGASHAA